MLGSPWPQVADTPDGSHARWVGVGVGVGEVRRPNKHRSSARTLWTRSLPYCSPRGQE